MQTEATTKKYLPLIKNYPFGSIRTISRLLGTEKLVLDVGCSSGYLAETSPKNIYYGIDGNKNALKKAAKLYKAVKQVDLNNLPKKPIFSQKFDSIVFADVLEHLLFPEDVLKYFKKNLKPGGSIIISLPNIALWRSRMNLLLGKFDYTDYGVMDRTHLHLYTFKSAKELLATLHPKSLQIEGAAYALGHIVNALPFLAPIFSVHIIIKANF